MDPGILADLRLKYERYSVSTSQGTRLLSAYYAPLRRAAELSAQRRGFHAVPNERMTNGLSHPASIFADFAGFKYLIRSCPGLDQTDDDVLRLFTKAAESDNPRTA
jgi:hypothetical protein